MEDHLRYGDLVSFHRDAIEVRGTVAELYGPSDDRKVVIDLTPEITGYIVDEPTTITWPVSKVRKVVAA